VTFSIIHPSIRPKKWREIYDAWIAAAERPEDVEYILAAGSGWNFDEDALMLWNVLRGKDNTYRFTDGNYVESVNKAAHNCTGDVLVVIADDIWPVKGWDRLFEESLFGTSLHSDFIVGGNDAAEEKRRKEMRGQIESGNYFRPKEFAIWVNNGWNEQGRGIMAMPVLSKSRFERLGYVYFPGYESMWADNDLAHHVMLDAKKGLCSLIKLAEPVFEHKHPSFDGSVPVDDQYRKQNRAEAYSLGQRLFHKRKQQNFSDTLVTEEPTKQNRKIAICVAGDSFPISWVARWSEIIGLAYTKHDCNLVFNMASSTNVYQMRMQMTRNVLSLEPSDYVLWLDDDQLATVEQVEQLIADLEENPDVAMVAGWTVCGADTFQSPPQLSFALKAQWHEFTTVEDMKSQKSDLMEVAYTGFPLVLMRGELLAKLGPGAFWPHREPEKLPDGEDVAFCKAAIAAGFRVCVDRRVGPLPHLKLRDIAAGVMG
jgi:hypothetical protein